MRPPAYPAARAVAAKVQPYFARDLAAARQQGATEVGPEPDACTMEAVIDAAFWASLRREEGYSPRISLALLPPELAPRPLTFERPLPLAPESLTRLAPAVERPGIHLGVWAGQDGELFVWGTTRSIPMFCFVVEVIAPGLLVIKHRRGAESRKFVNIAVLEGDQIKVLNHDAGSLPECPDLVTSLLGFDGLVSASGTVNVLVELAVSMREHRRGGSLLVVPAENRIWRESIVHPVRYSVDPPYSELARLMTKDVSARAERLWQDAFRQSVDAIAGLTSVDGATIITDTYELVAFGAKIGQRDGSGRVERVMVSEPIEGRQGRVMHPADLGGTRHLSCAQFSQDQRDSLALVASQDGRFTVFSWSACEEMVHAHRVEALLL